VNYVTLFKNYVTKIRLKVLNFVLACDDFFLKKACVIFIPQNINHLIIKHSTIMITTKMKKVLIALDEDPTAKKVAEVGYQMAESMGAEVFLVHVVEDLVAYSLSYLNMGPLQSDTEVELKDKSQQFLDEIKLLLGNETIQTVVKEGDFADCIIETAKELDIDTIVMGSLSKRWLENIVLGSVTERVMKQTTIPLFIVPTKKRD